uniref:phospholipase D n=1 Tax=Pseudomonas sp. GLE121 TaxID=1329969 RepID=R4LBU4_9PSED|nr:phospholipase D family protein [Pseudomonas sp. GLE121]AGL12876.1 endonuclease [Pseudomonas sp. GLE121]
MQRKVLPLIAALLFSAIPSVQAATAQVGFSPEGTAQVLVLDVIHTAKHDIRMMAYSFTAPDIAKALIEAKRRGVDVKIVVDDHSNTGHSSRAAMNLIVNAGIPLRTNDHYKIQHDKVIVIDGGTVQTGSFNYTASAERSNSENVLVLWNVPDVAKAYLGHWESRWEQGKPYISSY